jgi:hypothetical protein
MLLWSCAAQDGQNTADFFDYTDSKKHRFVGADASKRPVPPSSVLQFSDAPSSSTVEVRSRDVSLCVSALFSLLIPASLRTLASSPRHIVTVPLSCACRSD